MNELSESVVQPGTTPAALALTSHFLIEGEKMKANCLSASRYRAVTDLCPIPVFVSSTDGACIYVNPAYCRMLGIIEDQALGDGWSNFVHQDDREKVLRKWKRAVQSKRPYLNRQRMAPVSQVDFDVNVYSALLPCEGWVGYCIPTQWVNCNRVLSETLEPSFLTALAVGR